MRRPPRVRDLVVMPWNNEDNVRDNAIAEPRLRRVEIEDLDTATTVEVKVRREVGYVSLFLRHAFRLPAPEIRRLPAEL
jgi:alpha-D-ribose 1-methylphosphonate 5-triphosphate synthase subunit PhnL